jgi:hypothetical protein
MKIKQKAAEKPHNDQILAGTVTLAAVVALTAEFIPERYSSETYCECPKSISFVSINPLLVAPTAGFLKQEGISTKLT